MFKKALIGTAMLAAGIHLGWIGGFTSYTKTAYNQGRHYMQKQVPVEFEIERARQLARDLEPDIRKTRQAIAEEEVRIDRLRREVAQIEKNLKNESVAILAIRGQLGLNHVSYDIGGRSYSADALRQELNRRFTSYKTVDATLQSKRELLAARETALQGVRGQYEGLTHNRQQLEAELASLEARYKLVEARKANNQFQIDDSGLGRLRELVDSINDRVAVEDKLSQQEGHLDRRVPVEQIAPVDLNDQVDAYFRTSASESVPPNAL